MIRWSICAVAFFCMKCISSNWSLLSPRWLTRGRSQRTSSGWGLVLRSSTTKMQITWNTLGSSGEWSHCSATRRVEPVCPPLLFVHMFTSSSCLSLPQVFQWEGLFLRVREVLRLLSGRLGRWWHHVAGQRPRGTNRSQTCSNRDGGIRQIWFY